MALTAKRPWTTDVFVTLFTRYCGAGGSRHTSKSTAKHAPRFRARQRLHPPGPPGRGHPPSGVWRLPYHPSSSSSSSDNQTATTVLPGAYHILSLAGTTSIGLFDLQRLCLIAPLFLSLGSQPAKCPGTVCRRNRLTYTATTLPKVNTGSYYPADTDPENLITFYDPFPSINQPRNGLPSTTPRGKRLLTSAAHCSREPSCREDPRARCPVPEDAVSCLGRLDQ